jgi:hypothetical protein
MGQLTGKAIKLSDPRMSSYMELPPGTWTIGDKKYTVVAITEPNYDNTAQVTRNVIDLIEPAEAPAPPAGGGDGNGNA